MNLQFGKYNFDGKSVTLQDLSQVKSMIASNGFDTEGCLCLGNVGIFCRCFHSTTESKRERQPYTSRSGAVITWDGRLDNRGELRRALAIEVQEPPTDVEVVAAAYDQWGSACFARISGDWAITIWDRAKQSLLLAKDYVGARQLFYLLEPDRITWSSVLEPLVLLPEGSHGISEKFIAGYLSTYPATDLTPFLRIRSVPPATFVRVERGHVFASSYGEFDASHEVRHRSDADYEHHFCEVFEQAVRRRLRSCCPVVAELSGGMDSSAIVCMADHLASRGEAEAPEVHTISYYDDDEPNWDERPYFSLVEKRRGRSGRHVDVGGLGGALLPPDESMLILIPGYDRMGLTQIETVSRYLEATQSRVLLSGIGGDEFLGGVPIPNPELQDLLTNCQYSRFWPRLVEYSRHQRRPLLHLFFQTVEEFLPEQVRRLYKKLTIAPWLTSDFVSRNIEVFWMDSHRTHLCGARPSFQFSVNTLDHLRRQLNCVQNNIVSGHGVAYPYLDRDLLAFVFAIPRDQLVRPGQRRSLMKRALAGIVPPEILSRKRKAFVARRPFLSILSAMNTVESLLDHPLVAEYGWVDPNSLRSALAPVCRGESELLMPLLRTLRLELWLRHILGRVAVPRGNKDEPSSEKARGQRISRFGPQTARQNDKLTFSNH